MAIRQRCGGNDADAPEAWNPSTPTAFMNIRLLRRLVSFIGLVCCVLAVSSCFGFDSEDESMRINNPTVTGIASTQAMLGASITIDAETVSVQARGVLIAKTEDAGQLTQPFGIGVREVPAAVNEAGPFSILVTDLEPGTSYTFRGYGSYGEGNLLTDAVTFTTLPASGPIDSSFALPDLEDPIVSPYVNCIAPQADGRMLIAGDFGTVDGVSSNNVARINGNGSVDAGFQSALTHPVKVLAVQMDGKILYADEVEVGRLLPNGNADGGFGSLELSTFDVVHCVLPTKDGKILVGGKLEIPATLDEEHVVLLKADGSRESALLFTPVVVALGGDSSLGTVHCIAQQPDGKILIAGNFDSVNGQPRKHLARLAADGTVESTATFNIGTGANGPIRHVSVQANGKIHVWGAFTTFNGSTRVDFARLNANGSLDSAFVPPAVSRAPLSVAMQADGKPLLGGGVHLTERLTAAGLLDAGFNGAQTIDDYDLAPRVASLAGDGRILLGGVGTGPSPGATLLRLSNPGGAQTLGATHPSRVQWLRSGPHPEVSQVTFEQSLDNGTTWTLLGNGSPIATGGGWELTGLNMTSNGLLRARGRTVSTGGLSGTPAFSSGVVEQVADLIALGPPLVDVATVTSTSSQSVSLTSSISFAGASAMTERGFVYAFTGVNPGPVIGAPGVTKLTVPGTFTGILNGTANGLIAGGRYTFRAFASNAHGTNYSPPVMAETTDKPTAQLPTSTNITATSAVLGGSISSDGGNPVYERGFVYSSAPDRLMSASGVTKVIVSGSANPFSITVSGLQPATSYAFATYAQNIAGISYSPVATFVTSGGSATSNPNYAQALAVLPDGRTIVGGFFQSLGGLARSNLIRLHADGTPDDTFHANTDGSVYAVAVQGDGKLVIAGAFNAVNNQSRSNIARLHADGTLDDSFYQGVGASLPVMCLAIQPDGGILLGGAFTSIHNFGRNRIARLTPLGTVDTSFNPGTGADDTVFTIALQNDGGILLGGAFQNVNSSPRARLARLASNGSLESIGTFNPGSGPDGRIHCLAFQPDGKILVGGDFTSVNGSSLNRIARLNGDGSVESSATFNPGSGADGKIFGITLQADGKILAAGAFQNFNGSPFGRMVRLNADGSLDASFPFNPGADGEVDGVALLPGGTLQLAGMFGGVNGSTSAMIARVSNNTAGSETLSLPTADTARWMRGGSLPEVAQVAFDFSTDGTTWSSLGSTSRASGAWEVTGFSAPGINYQIRARGRTSGGYLSGSSSIAESLLRIGTDSDNDGLLDSWEITHFGTTVGHSALDDHDHDGVVELLELAFGGDPQQPDNSQPSIVEEGGFLTATITKHPGVIYTVESADSPGGVWSANATTILINDATTLKVRDNFAVASAPHRFIRVRVTAAP